MPLPRRPPSKLLVVSVIFAAPLLSQSTPQLLERLRLSAAIDSLNSSAPFHLKASIRLDPQFHRPAEQGTVELWSSSGDARRIVYDFPSYHATFLHTAAGQYQSKEAASPPYLIKYLVDQLLHPLPQSYDPARLKATQERRPFGKTALDCITLTAAQTKPPDPHPDPTVTYCLDSSSSDLRITFDIAGQATVRESVGTFRDRRVATQLAIAFTSKPVAHLHIDELKGQAVAYPETADTTALTADSGEPTYLPGQFMAGSVRSKEVPVYPIIARQDHISGSVLLHAIIGVDGHIRDLQVIGSPDDSLSESAMNAVRKWTYSPYLMNGKPTEVDTTITVNFNFGTRP